MFLFLCLFIMNHKMNSYHHQSNWNDFELFSKLLNLVTLFNPRLVVVILICCLKYSLSDCFVLQDCVFFDHETTIDRDVRYCRELFLNFIFLRKQNDISWTSCPNCTHVCTAPYVYLSLICFMRIYCKHRNNLVASKSFAFVYSTFIFIENTWANHHEMQRPAVLSRDPDLNNDILIIKFNKYRDNTNRSAYCPCHFLRAAIKILYVIWFV